MNEVIIISIIIGCLFEALILLLAVDFDLSIFNPIRNYDEWIDFNWFGIFVLTLLLNIVCVPYAICYWIYKIVMVICNLIYWLFTVGR